MKDNLSSTIPEHLREHYERVMSWVPPSDAGNLTRLNPVLLRATKRLISLVSPRGLDPFKSRTSTVLSVKSVFKSIPSVFLRRPVLAIALVFLILFGPLAYLFSRSPEAATAAWMDDNWGYRQRVDITNSAGSTLTNQRVKITLNTSALISAGKMQSDCDDIRVTDVNGKLLNHWDTSCNTTSTLIYVKTLSLPTSGAVLYLYYGNPSVTNVEKPLGSTDYPGTSCKMMKDQGSVTSNGLYYIVPGGNESDKIQVYCEVTTLSADWTMVLQNSTYSAPPKPNWSDAVNSINLTGTLSGSDLTVFDLLLGLRHWNYIGSTAMVQVGTTPSNITKRATYSSISLNAGNNYALSMSGETLYLGAGSPGIYTYHAAGNAQFSTYDADHDEYGGNCATLYSNTAWWYRACWSGSFWGGGDADGYQNAPFWDGSGGDYHSYGAIYLGGADSMKYASASSPGTEEKSQGPVAYWKMDEGYGSATYDATQNGNNGTIYNATWKSEDQCISGKCLYFNRASNNNYIQMPSASNLKIVNNDFTTEAWIKGNSFVSGPDNAIFGTDQTGSNIGLHLVIRNQRPYMGFYGNDTASNTVLETNKWYHIVFRYTQSNGEQAIFLNGVLDTSSTGHAAFQGTDNVKIGRWAGGYYFDGVIDEVKIYPYARSAAQIKADFAAKSSGSIKGSSAVLGSRFNVQGDYLSNGLVGYWKMDEASWTNDCSTASVTDSSGNGNNGKACPATTGPTGGAAGKFGNGGSIDGSDDYVRAEDASNLDFGTGSFTVAGWFYANSSGIVTNTEYGLVNKNSTYQNSAGWGIEYSSWGKSAPFTTLNVTGYNSGQTSWCNTCASKDDGITTDAWHHVALIRSGTTLYLYIDGQLQGTNTHSEVSTSVDNAQPVLIGDHSWGPPLPGKIDDVRIYNRSLSPKEVRDLYNWAPGPLAYWNFDEGSGINLNDISGNGFTGSINNSPTWVPGKYGKALRFNGSNQNVVVNGFGNYAPKQEITVEFWAKAETTSSYQNAFWIGNDTPDRINVHFLWGSSLMYWDFGVCCTPRIALDPGNIIGSWHHFAYVSSVQGGYMRIYKDGVIIGSNTSPGSFIPSNYPLYIASLGSSYYLQGAMDELKFYTYARTQKQIIEDMNAGHPAPGSPVGSQALYYKFDDGYGTIAQDSSPNNFDGTLVNSPTWSNQGKFAKALDFDSSLNQQVYSTIGSGVNPETHGWTLTYWVKSTQKSHANGGYIRTVGRCCSTTDYWLSRTHTNGGDYAVIQLVDSSGNSVGASGQTTVTDGNWHHLAFVYDYNNKKTLVYRDGIVDGTNNWSGITPTTINPTTDNLMIGDVNYDTERYDGLIDEVKIYNSALTEDEIKLDYNRGSAMVLGATSSEGGLDSYTKLLLHADGANGSQSFRDETGKTVTAYDNAQISSTQSKFGGTSASFDGTGDYLMVPAGADFNFGSGDFTIDTWVYLNNVSQVHYIYDGLPTGATGQILIHDTVLGWLFKERPSGGGYTTIVQQGSVTTSPNTWNHVALVRSGNNWYIFLNGTSVASNTLSYTLQDASPEVRIGRYTDSTAYMSGYLDEFRVSKGTARWTSNFNVPTRAYGSAGTNSSSGEYCIPGEESGCNPPIAEWKMDEKTGTTVNDVSGNSYTGTLTGSPTWTLGKYGEGVNFVSNDYMNLASPYLDLGADWTIESWFKYPFPSGDCNTLTRGNGGDHQVIIDCYGTLLGTYDNLYGTGFHSSGFNTNTLSTGWHHVAAVGTGSNTLFYIDGRYVGTATYKSTTDIRSVGGYFGGGQPFGTIDHVRVFNYARTAAQIAWDYNRGGPVGWWKMDECQGITANDASGNGNNGTITIGGGGTQTSAGTCSTSGTAWYNGATGKYNSSLNFDGTDDYVSTSITRGSLGDYLTVAAWFKYSGTSGETYNAIIGGYDPGGTEFFIGKNSGNTDIGIQDGNYISNMVSGSNAFDGNWHQIVYTYNSGTGKAYLDGVLKNTQTFTKCNDSEILYIGTELEGGGYYFDGKIDDVRIFNYALTATQVKSLFNEGAAVRFGPQTGSP